jgi:hypothetical protein
MISALVTALIISMIDRAAAPCSAGQLSDSMSDDDILLGGQAIVSSNGLAVLLMGGDGAIRIIKQQVLQWRLQPPNPNNRFLKLQQDGNLVLYDGCSRSECAAWSSGTDGRGPGPYRLYMQNNANAVLADATGSLLWSSGTNDSTSVGTRGVCTPCAGGTFSSAVGNLCSGCGGGEFSGEARLPPRAPGSALYRKACVVTEGVPPLPCAGAGASVCSKCPAGSYSASLPGTIPIMIAARSLTVRSRPQHSAAGV